MCRGCWHGNSWAGLRCRTHPPAPSAGVRRRRRHSLSHGGEGGPRLGLRRRVGDVKSRARGRPEIGQGRCRAPTQPASRQAAGAIAGGQGAAPTQHPGKGLFARDTGGEKPPNLSTTKCFLIYIHTFLVPLGVNFAWLADAAPAVLGAALGDDWRARPAHRRSAGLARRS